MSVNGRYLAQILACIGEQFTEGDEICGIVVNVRAKQDKLCVWTKTAANEAAQVNTCLRLLLPCIGLLNREGSCPN